MLTRRSLFAAPAVLRLSKAERQDRRSVLVLIGDDHSAIAGCYGNPVVATPNLDRLAKQGVVFSNAYCTTASCSASRSVILTGLHNHSNGQFGHAHIPYNFHTYPHIQSIPRLARAQGVATGVIGKLHVQPESVYPFEFVSPGGPDGGTRDVYGMAQEGARFLRQFDGRPFYLHVGYADPHRAADPADFGNRHAYRKVVPKKYSPADVIVPAFLPDKPEVRKELAEYYESISRLDQGIGFFLDVIEEAGCAKDTLVVYLGDNGMPFPGAKGSFYEDGLRCPLVVSSPRMKRRGHHNHALTSFCDILPTSLEWMGLKGPDYALHGRSLLSILDEEKPDGWDQIFFSHTFHEITNYYPLRGLRTQRYKFVHFVNPEIEMPMPLDLYDSPTWQAALKRKDKAFGARDSRQLLHHECEELYDLERDPAESRNVAGAPENRERLAAMRAQVQRFREATRDPWLRVDLQRKP